MIKEFKFNKGLVQVRAQTKEGFGLSPFEIAFLPSENSGWGITKDITESYAKSVKKPLARKFYFIALEMLGLKDESSN